MKNDEFIEFREFEKVASEIREIVEAEKDTMDKLSGTEELYITRLSNILKEYDRVKAKGIEVSHLNVDTTEYYTFLEFLASREEREETEEVKETKVKTGLSTEIKEIIEKYEREAKALNKGFSNFISENKILYVLKWVEKRSKILPLFYPVYDIKKHKKLTKDDIKNSGYMVTNDVIRMQEIFEKSNELMEKIKIEAEKGEE